MFEIDFGVNDRLTSRRSRACCGSSWNTIQFFRTSNASRMAGSVSGPMSLLSMNGAMRSEENLGSAIASLIAAWLVTIQDL